MHQPARKIDPDPPHTRDHARTPPPAPAPEAHPKVYFGDCLEILREKVPDDSVDLIFTSPPYCNQRSACYRSIPPDAYVEWFLPRAKEMQRVLRPTGTFVLNIKERVVDGERHTYVLDLIKGMREQGWRWTEEYIWHKKNGYPGKWPNRFRDLWERLLQFNRQKDFSMYQESVSVPVGDWARTRLTNLSETDRVRYESRTGNGFGKRVENWAGRGFANPGNVLHMATECGNKRHSAAFPVSLPDWFIRLFTQEGDVVLDPFLGSGTTLVAAQRLGRKGMGIELEKKFGPVITTRLENER